MSNYTREDKLISSQIGSSYRHFENYFRGCVLVPDLHQPHITTEMALELVLSSTKPWTTQAKNGMVILAERFRRSADHVCRRDKCTWRNAWT